MRARALHPDVIVITSALLQVNCVLLRGGGQPQGEGEDGPLEIVQVPAGAAREDPGESFLIDSPVLPDELDTLQQLVEQTRFPPLTGLLATHADWDHLLGRLAFPHAALGCAESSAQRLAAEPGAAQRKLRAFDEELYIERSAPLALHSPQALPVPGRCDVGRQELELLPAVGHTADGMAVNIPWAGVLVAGDYLSSIEIPMLGGGGAADAYLETLERLRPLVASSASVVPGHGPVLDGPDALEVLAQDVVYLEELLERGRDATLPQGRRSPAQRRVHAQNVAALRG